MKTLIEPRWRLIFVLLSTIVVCVLYFWRVHELKNQLSDTQSALADSSKLVQVYRDSSIVIKEKYAKSEIDKKNLNIENKTLRSYLADKDKKLLVHIQTESELRIENQKIKGILQTNEQGDEIAFFDTTTSYYSIKGFHQLKPFPVLDILELLVPDTTTVAVYKEGSFLKGLVAHSNPFIDDKGASFAVDLDKYSESWLKWWYGVVAVGLILLGVSL